MADDLVTMIDPGGDRNRPLDARLRCLADVDVGSAPPFNPLREVVRARVHGFGMALVGAAAVVVLLAVVLGAVSGGGDVVPVSGPVSVTLPPFRSGPCDPPEARPTAISADEVAYQEAMVRAAEAEAAATGFQRAAWPDPRGGRACGWTPRTRRGSAMPDPLTHQWDLASIAFPLHAAPSSSAAILGYDLMGVGFVPIEEWTAPGFDAEATRRAANGGCDPAEIHPTEGPDGSVVGWETREC